MHHSRLLAATAILALPTQTIAEDLPMVAVGLPFAPETPTPVKASHALYHDVDVGEIEGLPSTIKSSKFNFVAAAKRESVNTALRESFRRMNMLAEGVPGRKRLIVKWLGSHTPFRIGGTNTADVTIHYQLVRVDSGNTLFDRDITTSVEGGGVDASMRDNGIVRAAIAANFASAANCLDRASYGTAPNDCALVPRFSVSVDRDR
jgi:hypothetical protein